MVGNIRIRQYCFLLLLFLLLGTGALPAQEKHTEISVYFRENSIAIDSAYADNALRLHEISSALQTISQDSSIKLVKVPFCGFSSPDGSYQLNRRLAKGRLAALENLVRREMPLPDTVVPAADAGWIRHLHLKTNAVGWGMAIANVAVEVDLVRHWSFTLPIYFSAWNYFKSTIKLRTFVVQPEVRYWLSGRNDGFFAGAHFGMAYYNIAFAGAYRYQDYSRESPALGGGVSVGYRLPIGKSNHWRLELALGAGAYALHYNKFFNTPDTKDGALLDGSVRKTFIGIDRVAVSFVYTFDLKKKGAER